MPLSSPEDLCNVALDRLGYARHIADIYDGSPASRVALEVYGETRDALMAEEDWPFSFRKVALTVSGQTPPSPWANEYVYPGDCLRILYVCPGPLTGGTRNNDPKPVLFRPWNDNRPSPAIRTILCDAGLPAVLNYVGRVTDPLSWEPGFLEAFIDRLARAMMFGLNAQQEAVKAILGEAQQSEGTGAAVNDMRSPSGVTNGGK